jgi:triosephosphate isomerase
MKKKFLVANWKLNKNISEIRTYFAETQNLVETQFNEKIKNGQINLSQCEVWLAPQFIHLQLAKDLNIELINNNSPFFYSIGAQTVSHQDQGAFTGEVGASFLKDLGAEFTIVGHSERRQFFYETDKLFHRKIDLALNNQLKVIYCVGETLKERQDGKALGVIEEQLNKALFNIKLYHSDSLLIAYEPVWAIGTGKSATPAEVQEMHSFINTHISKIFPTYGKDIKILYGGSVKRENLQSYLNIPFVDGALVGGASLKANEFLSLFELLVS